jgi:hypothetical protein
MGEDVVELIADVQDLAGMDVDVRRLPLEAPERLVDHHARVRQAEALALGAAGEQQRAHARGLADAHGADVRADEAHGVVDGQPAVTEPPGELM